MMRKLRLDPDTLHVERFDPLPGRADERGTVLAAETGGCVTQPVEYTCTPTQTCPLTLESIAVNCPSMYCESEPGWSQFCTEEDDTGA